ncbi:type II toxin-antitoxin system VapC family toxin [Candidatus Bathyarchaeota archaeon]|nr:type II toxin-antitoxin system VapC family toxin [Candidatus Bathyarchaeota archaeon]
MKHVLDSSAIAIIFKRLKGEAVDVLEGNFTLDLAFYELGNMIWKECALKNLISLEEGINRAGQLAKVLEVVEAAKIRSSEDFKEVMRLATELRLTFYDTSYLQVAKKRNLPLVTGDRELRDKAREAGVKAMTVSELLKQVEG